MDYQERKKMNVDIISKVKYTPVDHSQYCSFVSVIPIKQRCSHCGKYFFLYERGIGGIITKDIDVVLCPACNEPYRQKTWTERQIEAGARALEEVSK